MGKLQGLEPGRIETGAARVLLVVAHTGFGLAVFLETGEAAGWVAGREQEMCQARVNTGAEVAGTEFHPLAAGIRQAVGIGRAPGVAPPDSWVLPKGRIWR